MSASRHASVLLVLIAVAPCGARGGEFPLWEAGVGAAVIDFPDYRGSDERRVIALPIPYLVYRGELLKADRGGLRGEFFRNDRVDLHLSVNGSIPVDSSDNATRRGMPDLDPTLEIGARFDIKLLRDADRGIEVTIGLPARTVIAADFSHSKNIGWVFQPEINVDFRDTWLGEGWKLGLAAGPLFGDRRYHNYFYGVPQDFATPQRPAYNAPGGYAGSQVLGAASKRFRSFWVGGFVRLDTLAGAVFEDSPLIRQNGSFAAGFAIAWILGSSQKMVEAEE
ncbi:MAG TPA: MipA/OmpV family protein [Burkholderiales bacterium]|nr:MipA/OmpV family protein [Burkholderiales bacterium]